MLRRLRPARIPSRRLPDRFGRVHAEVLREQTRGCVCAVSALQGQGQCGYDTGGGETGGVVAGDV